MGAHELHRLSTNAEVGTKKFDHAELFQAICCPDPVPTTWFNDGSRTKVGRRFDFNTLAHPSIHAPTRSHARNKGRNTHPGRQVVQMSWFPAVNWPGVHVVWWW